MGQRITLVFELLLIGAMLIRPSRRTKTLALASLAGLLLTIVAMSTVRHVGDSAEYVAMSLNLARLSPPSLAPQELVHARALFPADAGDRLQNPVLRAADGRQELPHFWFYSLLAAPFVRLAVASGAHPARGFSALNILLLLGLAWFLAGRVSGAVATFVVASPILWWVDKPHSEVLTFVLISVALTLLRSSPWWSIVAFGAAATQNPPMAGAMVVVIALALWQHGWRDGRVWTASAAGAILAGLHPLYYYWRLGLSTGLTQAIDRHWPQTRELTSAMFDPNLGIFIHDPWLLVAMVVALAGVVRRQGRHGLDAPNGAIALIAMLFIVSFTQTTNVNAGGTPGPSRYGLWLVPFAIPVLGSISPTARWMRGLAAASVVWCAWAFAPALPEHYLQPTSLAETIWRWWPSIDDPVAEVFAERVAGHEPARPPVATNGCEKVLLIGDGNGADWPAGCTSERLPDFCERKDALCYANVSNGVYRFTPAPSTPAWRADIRRQAVNRFSSIEGMLVVTQTSALRTKIAIWHEHGWSYAERLNTPTGGLVEWRWIDQRAELGVMADEPIVARLKIVARAFNKPRRIRISIQGRDLITLTASPSIAEYQSPEFDLGAGRASIGLESLDGSDMPTSGDLRRLSLQVFQIELVATR